MVGVIEPGAERAAAISKTRKVVVAATEATVASHAYQRALERQGMQATEKACPLFVPLVEEGWVEHRVTEEVAHIYMDEVFQDGARDADVLVLGCTHYPLIRLAAAEGRSTVCRDCGFSGVHRRQSGGDCWAQIGDKARRAIYAVTQLIL